MDNKRGSLLPSEKELKYFRRQFVQSAKLQGRLGRLHQIKDFKVKGTDQEYDYLKPVDVAYHLDENPSRKLLTKYGWFAENEPTPIVLILPYHDLGDNPIAVDVGCVIELSGKHSISENDIVTKQFTITKLTTDLEMNQAVCQIAPVREQQTENVKLLADEKDPVLDNIYLKRKIYFDTGEPVEEEPVVLPDLYINKGDTFSKRISKYTNNVNSKFVQGDEVYFTIRDGNTSDSNIIIQKVITSFVYDGKAHLTLSSSETNLFTLETYYYEIECRFNTGEIYTPLQGILHVNLSDLTGGA